MSENWPPPLPPDDESEWSPQPSGVPLFDFTSDDDEVEGWEDVDVGVEAPPAAPDDPEPALAYDDDPAYADAPAPAAPAPAGGLALTSTSRIDALQSGLDAVANRVEAIATDLASFRSVVFTHLSESTAQVLERLSRTSELSGDDVRQAVIENAGAVDRLSAAVALVATDLSNVLSDVMQSLSQTRELAAGNDELARSLSSGFRQSSQQFDEVVEELRALVLRQQDADRRSAEERGAAARDVRAQVSSALAELRADIRSEIEALLEDVVEDRGAVAKQLAQTQREMQRLRDQVASGQTTDEDYRERVTADVDQAEEHRAFVESELKKLADDLQTLRRRTAVQNRAVTLDDAQVAAMVDAIATAIREEATPTPPPPPPRATTPRATRATPVRARRPPREK